MLFIVEQTRITDNGSVIDSDDINSSDEDSNGQINQGNLVENPEKEINTAENSNGEINSVEDSMAEASNGEISCERDYREMRNAEDSWPVDSDA